MSHFIVGGPVAAEPKMHSRATLPQKGLEPAAAAVPDIWNYPNGTEIVFHAVASLRPNPMGRDARHRSTGGHHALCADA